MRGIISLFTLNFEGLKWKIGQEEIDEQLFKGEHDATTRNPKKDV